MSHALTSHVTHTNESRHAHERIMSHIPTGRTCDQQVVGTESRHTLERVTSHAPTSHVTHTNESWHAHERVMSHIATGRTWDERFRWNWVLSHTWTSHVTHTNESCHTHERVMTHMSQLKRLNVGECLLSHEHEMTQKTHTNESCHTHERVISHTRTSRVMSHVLSGVMSHISKDTQEWVMSHTRTSHVTHMNEASHTSHVFFLRCVTWVSHIFLRCVTWLVHVCDVTRSCVCDVTHSCVSLEMCDMSRLGTRDELIVATIMMKYSLEPFWWSIRCNHSDEVCVGTILMSHSLERFWWSICWNNCSGRVFGVVWHDSTRNQ